MKKILLITTGGTIASKRTESGLAPLLTSEELLGFIPGIEEICQIHTHQLFNLDSTHIHPKHWSAAASLIKESYPDYDGFVITHGTDTMAYTAAALSYFIQNSPKPIVITGAQRPIDMENTDARENLFNSFLFACHDKSQDVNIVFGGKVIAGTRARKVRTKSYNAFSSINFPHIALIQDKKIFYYVQPVPHKGDPLFSMDYNKNICIMKIIPGLNDQLLSCASNFFDGLVLESYGVGGIPDNEEQRFELLISEMIGQGKTIVMATQVPHEGSDMTVYKVGHGLKEKFDLLETYDMNLESTVTKLMWILGQTNDPAKIRELFYKQINYDLLFSL